MRSLVQVILEELAEVNGNVSEKATPSEANGYAGPSASASSGSER